jgi:hypothetical protein
VARGAVPYCDHGVQADAGVVDTVNIGWVGGVADCIFFAWLGGRCGTIERAIVRRCMRVGKLLVEMSVIRSWRTDCMSRVDEACAYDIGLLLMRGMCGMS